MVNNSNTPRTFSFQSSPPDGWKPRTPLAHDVQLMKALDECETPDDKHDDGQAKKNRNKSSSISRKLVLMSPDDIVLHHGGASSRQLFSPKKNPAQHHQHDDEPFAPATINPELEATGKIAAMCTADIYDEHGCIQNTYKAYQPKIDEFNLYCKTFYNTNKALTYQITKNKVESYLSYCWRGPVLGGPRCDILRARSA